jgi:hypothetical protein
MPIKSGSDTKGSFYQWGSGTKAKKYYYTPGSKISRNLAMGLAKKQGARKKSAAKHGGGENVAPPALSNILEYVVDKS